MSKVEELRARQLELEGRIAELEGLQRASGMGMDLPCMHCRNVFKQWYTVQARLKLAETALEAASHFMDVRKTSHDGEEIHGAALAFYAQLEAWKKAAGKT